MGLCERNESIFKSLFVTSDDYCKLLLLDEILEIGTLKEIPFLASLQYHHHPKIRKKALLIKSQLEDKLEFIQIDKKNQSYENPHFSKENSILKDTMKEGHEVQETPKRKHGVEKSEDLIALEFCLLSEVLGLQQK